MGPMDAAVGIPLASLHCQTTAPVHHTMFCLLPSYCCSLDQPTRDGQAELTWVASYTPRFTRASTNSGKCRATCYQAIYKYGRVQRPTPQIIGHFGDDLPSKTGAKNWSSLRITWLLIPKPNITTTKCQHKKKTIALAKHNTCHMRVGKFRIWGIHWGLLPRDIF